MLTAFSPSPRHRALLVRTCGGLCLVVAVLVGVTGCPSTTKESANVVSGTVKLGNDPVAGTVIFVASDNKEYPTPIMVSGQYKLENPPIGKCKIVVKPMGGGLVSPAPPPKDSPALPKVGGAEPPLKYRDAKTTDLEYEVKAGKQTYDVVLKN